MFGSLKLYYKNVTSQVIGDNNGISEDQIADLAGTLEPIITQFNKDRNNGITAYRDLPYIQSNLEKAKSLASKTSSNSDQAVLIATDEDSAAYCNAYALLYNLKKVDNSSAKLFVYDRDSNQNISDFLDDLPGKLDRTFVNIVSNSASESIEIAKLVLDRIGTAANSHNLCITTSSEDDSLAGFAEDNKISIFTNPQATAASLSILCETGLLYAALGGIDIEQMLAGARAMDVKTGTEEFGRNPAAIYAAISRYYQNNELAAAPLIPTSDEYKNLCELGSLIWQQLTGLSASQQDIVNNDTANLQLIFDQLNDYNAGQLIYLMQVAGLMYAKHCELPGNIITTNKTETKLLIYAGSSDDTALDKSYI